MSDSVYISFDDLLALVERALRKGVLSVSHARAIARVIVEGERSVPVTRHLSFAELLEIAGDGQDVARCTPKIHADETAIIRANANRAFSSLALETSIANC